MKRYVNLLLLVICMELVLPLPFYADAVSQMGIDPVRPFVYLVLLIMISLLVAVLLRGQIREKTGCLEARIQELERQLADAAAPASEHAQGDATERFRSDFLANIGQEIRAPMNGIIGMTELTLATALSKEQEDQLQMVKKSAHSLLALINEMVDVSKIESGQVEIEAIPFRLRQSLDSTLADFTVTAEANGLAFGPRIDDEIPDELIGDPSRLRQIVVSLLNQAIKTTAEGRIDVHLEAQSADEEQVIVHLAVRDSGPGVPPDQREAMFDFQAGEPADGPQSHGLSLAVAAQLVHRMDGEIWIESPAPADEESAGGPGSVFHVTLRFGLPKAAPPEQSPVDGLSLKGLPVLVVDDCPTDRQSLEDMLSLWELRPTGVKNAVEAMLAMESARTGQDPFALVILDANLPEIDGYALAQEIRRSEYFQDTKLIILTSAAMRGDGQRCRELGIAAYLPKPVDQSDLLHTIMEVMQQSGTEAAQTTLVTRHWIRERRRPLRILLADRNPANQKFVVRLLEKWGHQVELLTMDEGAGPAVQGDFDLALIDLQLSRHQGLQVAKAVRTSGAAAGRTVRIVGLAAPAQSTADPLAAEVLDATLAKPIRIDELYAVTLATARDMSTLCVP